MSYKISAQFSFPRFHIVSVWCQRSLFTNHVDSFTLVSCRRSPLDLLYLQIIVVFHISEILPKNPGRQKHWPSIYLLFLAGQQYSMSCPNIPTRPNSAKIIWLDFFLHKTNFPISLWGIPLSSAEKFWKEQVDGWRSGVLVRKCLGKRAVVAKYYISKYLVLEVQGPSVLGPDF